MNPSWMDRARSFLIVAARGKKIQWGGVELLIVVILFMGILCLASTLVSSWIQASRGSGLIQVSLSAISSADYSVDDRSRSIPVIGLEIIKDILSQNENQSSSEDSTASAFIPGSPTPSPTATRFGVIIPTATPENLPGVEPTIKSRATETSTSIPLITSTPPPQKSVQPPTGSPAASSTPPPSRTPIPSTTPPESTPFPTSTSPAATATQPPLGNTSTPTPNPLPSSTNTPFPSPTQRPNPTSPPASSPTPQPTPQPTSPPTRSPTLVVTPTSGYTPIVTGFPYPFP